MSDSENKTSPKRVTSTNPTYETVEGRSPSSPVYDPIVSLPEVETQSMEENENEILKIRAKLYRFNLPLEEDESAVWKERGVGYVKLLQDKDSGKVRIVMRREKTLKLCANHFITKDMSLKELSGNERARIWYTAGDFSDGTLNPETLCLRFESTETAKEFHDKFMNVVDDLNSNKDLDEQLDELKIVENELD
eukprot:TRINITY_DN5877_c2_g1_i1.p1 TRINITY_DN5877_c2_g1~~TRINITY_DN5877_c2_g1_i1.p1  ORF type:complete len:193 (-),score=50.23 TRINITY_DN5877_c2_g1_i1:146-724(-)